MTSHLIRLTAVSLVAGLLIAMPVPAQGPAVPPFRRDDPIGPPPAVPAGDPQVETRGPVHEGFARPSDGTPRKGPLASKAPPEPIAETPPEEKPEGESVMWLPGYWMWDDDRDDYIWVSGCWRVAPPGRQWVPGYWAREGAGHRWVSGLWAQADGGPLPYTEPPPSSLDVGPAMPAPTEFSTYVPGIWVNRERWLWRPGYWIEPREDWVYCPPSWNWTPRGHLFCGGFWDRPWGGRGVLFAPVFFGGFRPAFWSPSFVVGVGPLVGNLWLRPGCGYHFGDFYGSRYAGRGFTAWATHGPRVRDPLFGHYRHVNRSNPNWANRLRTDYEARVRDERARPPRTLAAQDRSKGPAVVEPLNRIRPETMRLTKASPAERTERARAATALTQTATERRALEGRETTKALPTARAAPGPRAETPSPRPAPSRIDSPPPKIDRPTVREDRPTPKIDRPPVREDRPTPKIDRPTPKVEAPRPTPKADAPRPTPKADTPRVAPPPAPRIAPTPQPAPRVASPPTPRVAPPPAPRVAPPPAPAPRVAPPVSAPRPTPRATPPAAAPRPPRRP